MNGMYIQNKRYEKTITRMTKSSSPRVSRTPPKKRRFEKALAKKVSIILFP